MTPLAVALGDLAEVVVAAFVAGVGITAIFSLGLLGTIRRGPAWNVLAAAMALAVLLAIGWGLKIVAG